jgi:hypothetical protein
LVYLAGLFGTLRASGKLKKKDPLGDVVEFFHFSLSVWIVRTLKKGDGSIFSYSGTRL